MTATEILYEELYKTIEEVKAREEVPFKSYLLEKVEKIIAAIYALQDIGTRPKFDRALKSALAFQKGRLGEEGEEKKLI